MKTLSIDIETYSDVNLAKCGVYKYAESPAFEILLFGYAVDGGPVQVVDLAQGESIPEEILDALTDDTVTKSLTWEGAWTPFMTSIPYPRNVPGS